MSARTAHRLVCTLCLLLPNAAAFGQDGSPVVPAANKPSAQAVANYARMPLSFEPNLGQTTGDVQWLARGADYTLFLSGHDAVLEMGHVSLTPAAAGVRPAPTMQSSAVRMNLLGAQIPAATAGQDPQPGHANYFTGNDPARWQHDVPMYGKVRLDAVYPGIDLVYYGTRGDLEYDFIVAPGADASAIRLALDGADPHLNATGDLILPVNGTSDEVRFKKPVVYQVENGVREPIDASFHIAANGEVSFAIGAYDHSRELVIDPQLLFLGAYGTGTLNTTAASMTVDPAGEIMLTGITQDLNLPVTTGALQTTCGTYPGSTTTTQQRCGSFTPGSAFVAKISADGTSLVYSTYLHGNGGYEYGSAIATDAAGDAYVLGSTGSNDFPVTSDAYQTYCRPYVPTIGVSNPSYGAEIADCDYYINGGTGYTVINATLFVVKLNPSGSNILYGTFFGGTDGLTPVAIALDTAGAIYFTSWIGGPNPAANYYPNLPNGNVAFPTTASAYEPYVPFSGNANAATLSKLSADGHTLLYSTLLSTQSANNPASTYPTALATGSNGFVFLGGWTGSSSFPTTAGAFDTTCPLGSGTNPNCKTGYGFLSAFDTTKSGAASLVWSTYVGGTTTPNNVTAQDQVLAVAVDGSNNAYATGYTYDSNYPTTTGAYQTTCAQAAPNCNQAFVTKFAAANGAALWSTYFGNTTTSPVNITPHGIVLDAKGRVTIYGDTDIGSNGGGGTMPFVNPIETTNNAGKSLFLSTFSADGSSLLFSTQIHNTNTCCLIPLTAISQGLAIDATGNLYFGATASDNGSFPFTTGTYNTTAVGDFTRGLFGKISPVLQPTATTLLIAPSTTVTGQSVAFTATVTGTQQTTPTPTGSVKLVNNSATPPVTLGTITLASGTGTFSTKSLAVGNYSVTGTYSADATYDASSSTAQTLVINNPAVATITLTAPTTATVGTPVTFSVKATGTSATPTGTVNFLDGTTILSSQTLVNGAASYTISSLSVGTHNLSITYSGDSTFGPATSTVQTLTISLVTPTIALTVPTTATVGSPVTFSVKLTGGSATPTGTVNFLDGTTILSSQTLVNGAASYTISSLSVGTHNLSITYSGDSTFGAATSSVQTLTISLVTPTVTLTVPASAVAGASVTMSAMVTGTGGTPTGTVTFKDGTTTLSVQTLSGGAASYTTSSLTAGAHSITVSYSGDSLFAAATTTSTQTITITSQPSFSFAASPAAVTVASGATGTTSITVTPAGGFAGTVTFACGSLPAASTCSFAPVSLVFTAGSSSTQSTTLSIATVITVARSEPPAVDSTGNMVLVAVLLLPLGFGRRLRKICRSRGPLFPAMLLCAALLGSAALLGLSGCSHHSTQSFTPSGSYTVPVLITSNGTTSTLNIPLTVQ